MTVWKEYFADLHIHIGSTMYGKPVKITASKNLTLTNILVEASKRKGLDMIGIIDAHVPAVQEELEQLILNGEAFELEEGGVRFQDVTLLLGSEVEIYDSNCYGPIHILCFFPNLEKMQLFTNWFSTRVTNITLSSQRMYGTAKELQEIVKRLKGLFIPAHVFTPFKSLYGKGVKKTLQEVFDPALIDAVELGLSSDTTMADQIQELSAYTFLTNSDAHSLKKIAREYQKIRMNEATFKEFRLALGEKAGRKVLANYGMNPVLGKYFTTVCAECLLETSYGGPCIHCGNKTIIKGVSERITELASSGTSNRERPDYIHQVPLEYLPGLGVKTLEKLLDIVGTEMYILHKASKEELRAAVKENIVQMIVSMRRGELSFEAGGGGKYGKVSMQQK
ncbi:uncharacterized protein (TIGR00375 family) [Salirhabdus euzebyi]|uniref:Uncharacterized protein (TIGR00375 family) n=1 Tax=Salirhabdus euzebyi TaxID=394506 RepID=A0A841QA93_9BACI|nr:endonuclease Q family protein [Salirhabdus euzebyi]MBB6455316.1 uncharacterized protein (TIGR00375 family) [Salirhabdus euzebyi]